MANLDVPTGPAGNGGDALLGGRYRLLDVLGRGAMATVYRAVDETLGREVAVKLFLPGSGDDDFRMRQETEMRLMAGFDHPGLVSLYDAGMDSRETEALRAYLVMELVPGTNLRTRLFDGALTPVETARIAHCLAEALIQVHANGVIHRDIKPANILIPESGTVAAKLTDFGVARIVDGTRLTTTGMTVGTASYLSPEQAMGREVTPASDIYSLGLVMLECLSGVPEYPGTPMESAAARLHRAPRIPGSLPPAYAELLQGMTEFEPGNRPSAETVAATLGELLMVFNAAATAPTSLIPEMPDHPPVLGPHQPDPGTAALPAGAVPAPRPIPGSEAGSNRRPRGRRRSPVEGRPPVAARRRFQRGAIIAALLLVAAVGLPLFLVGMFNAPLPAGTSVTTPAGTPSGSDSPETSPTPPVDATSSAPPAPAPAPEPTAVAPAPVPSAVAPAPQELGTDAPFTGGPDTKGPGSGKGADNSKGKKP